MDPSEEASEQLTNLPPRPALPDVRAARSHGPAEAVDAQWETIRLQCQWQSDVRRLQQLRTPYMTLGLLLDIAATQPRLRRLFPFTSHFTLGFSRFTTYTWRGLQGGSINAQNAARLLVQKHHPHVVIGETDSAEEAIAALIRLLPADDRDVTVAPEGVAYP